MDTIRKRQIQAKKKYDQGENPFSDLYDISMYCLRKLNSVTRKEATCSQNNKSFWIYESSKNYSRPVKQDLFISQIDQFDSKWQEFLSKINSKTKTIALETHEINKILYSAIIAFSVCFDLWKPKSRKTPGTYFEILVGSILGELLDQYNRSKHIPIPGSSESVSTDSESVSTDSESVSTDSQSVSTDIVFSKSNDQLGLVIPVKITTRERIVQPYAHQRILDSCFGEGKYISILICVSESQRDEHIGVKEICVPGTIKLFQEHLARLGGIYYLDPPTRYLEPDLSKSIKIDSLGSFLSKDLSKLI